MKIKILSIFSFFLVYSISMQAQVKVYEGKETMRTYRLGPAEPSPLFYTGRNVQGAAGHFYPYPAQITLGDSLTDEVYDMVYLENEYLKVTILPALGGKLFSAIDKTNGHELFHRNSTVKPDLIGTLGAWISGGIEWCFPHHHRTTTFLPSDYRIVSNSDGSATVWVGETEKSLHLRGIIGITLHPGKSYIDVVYRLNNPNPVTRNFKFWANVAVTADNSFRTFFPPSQEIGVFHHNSSFTHWPISHEVYKGTDYTSGVDMTWYKNHPSPVSVFFWEGEEGFIGGYDYDEKAGIVHVADKYINRASKLWEWGPGLEGANARRKLTDDGRDYVELMTGSWSNNQPDYSWFAPYTVKETQNFWYPIRDIEIAKNATLDAAVTLQMRDPGTVFFGFNTTRVFRNAKVILLYDSIPVFERIVDIDPGTPFTSIWQRKTAIDEYKLTAALADQNGSILVSYSPYRPKNPELPDVFEEVRPAHEIESVEDLYLTGRFVEQFARPYNNADDYYLAALDKSPDDYRVNLALGIRRINQWKYTEAENYLQKAADKLMTRYVQPAEGELFYYMGIAQRALGKWNEAYRNFHRAAFYYEWFSQGNFQLAQMESEKGNYEKALEYISDAYSTNNNDGSVVILYSALLRRLDRIEEARALANKLAGFDPLNFSAVCELDLLSGSSELKAMHENMQDIENNYIEIAVNYINAGLYDDAFRLLSGLSGVRNPVISYYCAYLAGKLGNADEADRYIAAAHKLSVEYSFPFRKETEQILTFAHSKAPEHPYPLYLLGNLLYDNRPEEAIEAWQAIAGSAPELPMIWRNLAFGACYYRKDAALAADYLEKALDSEPDHPMWYAELEKYYDLSGKSPEKCLGMMESHIDIVKRNLTAPQSLVKLYNIMGQYDKSIDFLESHHFRTWEGGRSIYWHYIDAQVMKAIQLSDAGANKEAVSYLEKAFLYPENLEVGKPLHDERNAMIYYFLGNVYEKAGNKKKAREAYAKSIDCENTDDWPDLIFYQGLAYQKTGDTAKAGRLFADLTEAGKRNLDKAIKMPDDGAVYNMINKRDLVAEGYYLQALGEIGRGNIESAGRLLVQSHNVYKNNLWVNYYLGLYRDVAEIR